MKVDFFNKVMDLLVDAICVVDAEGRFVFVSAACEQLFGYTREEMIGKNMLELVYPEDRARTLHAVDDIMGGEPKTHFENRYVRKDGRIAHIMWSARWSEPDRLRLAVARDVTELKRAERINCALFQISEAAHTADGLSALYQRVHEIIAELLPAQNFCVALYDEPSNMLSFPYRVDEHEIAVGLQALDAEAPIAEVIRSGRALLTTTAPLGTCAPAEARAAGVRGEWLGAPLLSQDGVMGALVVQNFSPALQYTEDDKELLQYVCTQVATAIERKQNESRLRHMARHDALTDLPNRRLFDDRLETALSRARRDGEQIALLYLDLDGFKRINDSFGHAMGDQLLLEIARRLSGCVRASDTIGRIGGDEFTVLLANLRGSVGVEVVVEKIRAELGAPFELDGCTLSIAASIGTAIYPEHGEDKEQLFRHADADMYAAKRANRQATAKAPHPTT